MPSLPAVIDIEASGFGRASYPIEIGYVLPDATCFCTLVQPAPHWTHWDAEAERVHQIRRESIERHGRNVHEVARLLNERLGGMTVYSDGWANDYPWIGALYEEADLSPSFRLETLRALLNEDEARAWHDTKQRVRDELALPRHRASADARVLQLTLQRLRNRAVPA